MDGSYNNSLDDVLSAIGAEVQWMSTKGKVNPFAWDYVALYISDTKVNDVNFPNAVLQCYLNKIKLGVAWSSPTQVDNAIAYNNRQTDPRKKLVFMTTELEAYGTTPNCTVSQYRSWIPQAYLKLQANKMLLYIYEGWNYNYDVTVPNSDGFLLHAYRTSTQMLNLDDCYNYLAGSDNTKRLAQLAAQGKTLGRIVDVALLTSSEATYGQEYYKTHAWEAELALLKDSWMRKATVDIKKYIALNGSFVFTSKVMKLAKP